MSEPPYFIRMLSKCYEIWNISKKGLHNTFKFRDTTQTSKKGLSRLSHKLYFRFQKYFGLTLCETLAFRFFCSRLSRNLAVFKRYK